MDFHWIKSLTHLIYCYQPGADIGYFSSSILKLRNRETIFAIVSKMLVRFLNSPLINFYICRTSRQDFGFSIKIVVLPKMLGNFFWISNQIVILMLKISIWPWPSWNFTNFYLFVHNNPNLQRSRIFSSIKVNFPWHPTPWEMLINLLLSFYANFWI